MIYLGKVNIIRDHRMVAEEIFPVSEQGYTTSKLLHGTECQLFWIPELVNHLCLNYIICAANHFIHYPTLYQKHKEFK